MPKPPLRWLSKGLLSRLPLRAVLIIPFVLQILLVAGLIGFLSFRNGESAVRSLATELETEIGQRVEQTLETYLKMPQLSNQIMADAVRRGALSLETIDSLQPYLWDQFRQFNNQYLQAGSSREPPSQQPDDISFVGIGTEQGDYVDVGYYLRAGRLTMSLRDRRQDDTLYIWEINQWGRKLEVIDKAPRYDPRSRKWYQSAVKAGRLIWTGPYHTVAPDNDYVISANQPLYDRQGNVVGVADATLSLRDVNRFLQSLQVGKSGQIFITKQDGELLAISAGKNSAGKNSAGKKGANPTQDSAKPAPVDPEIQPNQKAFESSDPVTRDTAEYLRQKFGSFERIAYAQSQQPHQLEFRDTAGQKHFVRVEPFRNPQFMGLDWLVVITVPEADFMAEIRANTWATMLLCLLGVLGAILFGIAAGRWLTKPIVQLSRAADALSRGDWQRPVTIQRSGELGLLVNAFNRMRHELRQSHQQLEEYSRGLEQKNEQLRTLEGELRRQLNLFLHAVSHDLRNPVLGTAMVLNNLSRQAGDEVTLSRHILERMQESNQRQLDLINSLIDTHAAEIWGIALHTKPAALRPLVVSAIADLQPMMEKEQTHLDNQIPADLPLVQVDPLQLARVYQNLLANAMKHNPTGLTLQLTAAAEANWIYCTVSDNGVGINSEQCERLFDPYFRGAAKPKSVGLGLGLYLCQQIVQAHGGTIGVKSQPGSGTTFWFTLPVSREGGGEE